MTRNPHLFAAFLLLTVASLAQGQTRSPQPTPLAATWHGVDGQVLLSGTLSSVEGESAHIVKPDNSTGDIKLNTLSLADRAFALTHQNKESEFQRALRQWTSAGGKYHIDAKAISIEDQTARLALADNKIISVPLDKISSDDRSYIDRLQQASKLAEKEPDPFTTVDDPFGSVETFTGYKPPIQTRPQSTASRAPTVGQAKLGSAGSSVPSRPAIAALEGTANGTIVYVTNSGTKYHSEGCRYLSKSNIPMPLSQAIGQYSPCSVCHPPISADSTSPQRNTSATRTHSHSTPPPTSLGSEFVDRNPYSESVTGQTATGIPTYTGPRGGQYHYSKSGKKVYEKKK